MPDDWLDALMRNSSYKEYRPVVIKLVDVVARAAFVLTATFSLPIADAGRFGLIVTLVGIFAFVFNFERHIDIQRRTAGEEPAVFDRHVTQALKFFAFNWIIMVPVFGLAIALWAEASPWMLSLAVMVVLGEHLSNQAYQYAMIDSRYQRLLSVVAAKNAALAIAVLWYLLILRERINLESILEIWAFGAVLCTLSLGVSFAKLNSSSSRRSDFDLRIDIFGQHRASMTHFAIGLLAILMLQFDRLVVGGLMSFAETGRYYRHTLLVSLAYQAFGIASFNRISPSVFAESKTMKIPQLNLRVQQEYRKTVIGAPLLLFAAWCVDVFTDGTLFKRLDLEIGLMGVLLLGFMFRARADFYGLVLNSLHREREVLVSQSAAFLAAGVLLIALTWWIGVYGAAASTVVAAIVYMFLVRRSLLVTQS